MKTPDEIKPYREISMPVTNAVTNVDNVDLIKECSYRLTADISDYLEQLATPKWISVEDALPQAGRICAVYGRGRDNRPRYDLAIMDKARTWEFGAMSAFEITHWMALPQLPSEEENETMKDVLSIEQLKEQFERRKRILDTLLSTDAPKAVIEKAQKSLLLTQRRLERAQAAD